ncbi:MAG TPA: hypothetical protein DHV59_15335 [Oxalobacteraceae bacterium]|nr:hypothetical protein [Oxalobacteraceae bacterium]
MSARSAESPAQGKIHPASLAVALAIMIGGSLYPPMMADSAGNADHALAMALFWAMSAGFVHGVGFRPIVSAWRWLFSGWACLAALGLAAWIRMLN